MIGNGWGHVFGTDDVLMRTSQILERKSDRYLVTYQLADHLTLAELERCVAHQKFSENSTCGIEMTEKNAAIPPDWEFPVFCGKCWTYILIYLSCKGRGIENHCEFL